MVFNLASPGIKPESTVLLEDLSTIYRFNVKALSTRPLIGSREEHHDSHNPKSSKNLTASPHRVATETAKINSRKISRTFFKVIFQDFFRSDLIFFFLHDLKFNLHYYFHAPTFLYLLLKKNFDMKHLHY